MPSLGDNKLTKFVLLFAEPEFPLVEFQRYSWKLHLWPKIPPPLPLRLMETDKHHF